MITANWRTTYAEGANTTQRRASHTVGVLVQYSLYSTITKRNDNVLYVPELHTIQIIFCGHCVRISHTSTCLSAARTSLIAASGRADTSALLSLWASCSSMCLTQQLKAMLYSTSTRIYSESAKLWFWSSSIIKYSSANPIRSDPHAPLVCAQTRTWGLQRLNFPECEL